MGHPNGERQKSEAMDQMIARRAEIAFQVKSFKIKLNKIFQIQKLDLDKDGVITLDEFLTSCMEDKKMAQSFINIEKAKET